MKNNYQLPTRIYKKILLFVLIAGLVSACVHPAGGTAMTSEPSTSSPTTSTTPISSSTATYVLSPTITSTVPPTASSTPIDTPTPTITPTSVCLHILNPPDATQYSELGELKFTWESVVGAVKYRLEIKTPNDTAIIFETFMTSVNRYLIMYPWGGKYTWKLTAIGPDGSAVCIAGPFSFTKTAYAPTEKPGKPRSDKWRDSECG